MKEMGEGQCPFGFGAKAEPSADARSGENTGDTGPRHMGMALGLPRDSLPRLASAPIASGANDLPTGRCMCGKISFQINRPVEMVFANHDAQSRRRSGGVALTIMIRAKDTLFNGWGHLVHYPLSAQENACFCRACGTPMLTYFLAPEPLAGMAQVSAGALDDSAGLHLAADISTDAKPGYYTFKGERRDISSQELAGMLQRQPGDDVKVNLAKAHSSRAGHARD